ncbi:MAG: tRNA pseudouridine(38-40) synthase TruA [Clostridia bacterium]|nr:tRNA pseudouridine(38-40) synthase TruA [Clostridia bacterium]MDR3643993.1 tRNA pseudouridine(38-40) synthase TruA [Clostridia bacterium]
MRNIRLALTFDGTNYHGWQVQQNAMTVQQKVQDVLGVILGRRPLLTGCSRTDAGVHANEYICNFTTDRTIACDCLLRALNAALPRDIAVLRCGEAPVGFHARYDAVSKEYLYKIDTGPVRNPFLRDYALYYPHALDAGRLDAAASAFLGTHDFRAFCASGGSIKDLSRTVTRFSCERSGPLVTFTVRADGFLYNMVRIMAGTLLYVAQGRLAAENLPAVIAGGERAAAGPTAPAHGLYLNRVFYSDAKELES